jgi:capsular exopolysaccharide synthesis family protein
MTTLPQTTPLRLPRPASTAPLAIPGAVAHIGPAGHAAAPQMSGADVWRVIRSNLLLIIIMVALGAGAGWGSFQYLNNHYPKFTATGTIQIMPPPSTIDPLRGTQSANNMDSLDTALQAKTQALLLREQSLFTDVLMAKGGVVQETAWYKSFKSPAEAKLDLQQNFVIQPEQDTTLLHVSMTCADKMSAKVIVDAIVDKHIAEEKDLNRSRELDRHMVLTNARSDYDSKSRSDEMAISQYESELNSDGVTGTGNRISAKDMELQGLLDNLQKINLDAATDNDDYKAIVDQINAGQDPAKVAQLIYSDPLVVGYKNMSDQLELNIDEMIQTMGAAAPQIQVAKDRLTLIQGKYDAALADARLRYRTSVTEEAKEKYARDERTINAINDRVKTLQDEMGHLTLISTQLLQKKDEKANYDLKIKAIDDQLNMMAAFDANHDYSVVAWAAHPEDPDSPSFPKLPVTMSVGITFGLFLALGIAFLREFMDTSIRSPRDISRVGNMNLLGMVPHEDDDPQSAGARLPVVIFEAPHSMMAEQLRQVRTRLQHSSSLDTTRSILVTSPSPGDGKSTIACNLASGLALNGRRILLVDANFRRPELHRIFNLTNETGFSDVLNSLEAFEHSIQETQVPNLYVLPSGIKPTNATELLESQLLMDFIERALEEFDHVIFDSGPLLFVSETVALAPRVDGVVTVVRARTNSRGVLSRMRDSLRQVKAEHLGVVLNAVRAQGGGYYGRNIRTYYEYQNGGPKGAA